MNRRTGVCSSRSSVSISGTRRFGQKCRDFMGLGGIFRANCALDILRTSRVVCAHFHQRYTRPCPSRSADFEKLRDEDLAGAPAPRAPRRPFFRTRAAGNDTAAAIPPRLSSRSIMVAVMGGLALRDRGARSAPAFVALPASARAGAAHRSAHRRRVTYGGRQPPPPRSPRGDGVRGAACHPRGSGRGLLQAWLAQQPELDLRKRGRDRCRSVSGDGQDRG